MEMVAAIMKDTVLKHLVVSSTPRAGLTGILDLLAGMGCSRLPDAAVQEWLNARSTESNLDATASFVNHSDEPALLSVNPDRPGVSLSGVLDRAPAAKLLFLHARPERALIQAMTEGVSIKEELDRWAQTANAALEAFRHNRRNVILCSLEAVLADPRKFVEVCQKQFGLQETTAPDLESRNRKEIDPIHQLLAAQMVAQSAEVQELLALLEASSLPLGVIAGRAQVDCEAVHQALQKTGFDFAESRQALEAKCKDLDEENELLLLQLHQVQEELESYYLQLKDAQEQQRKLQAAVAERDATIEKQHRNSTHHEKRCKALEAETNNLRSQLAGRERTLAAMRDSTSWKVTRPIRALKSLFVRKPRKAVS